ncbi:MAG: hypothetical protein Q9174_003328, partial [Haloplaca sp. 1 TL-2023]
MLLKVVSLLLLSATPLLATDTAGDPTDITNWPACAQNCIPQGFGPPANCGSLSNLTCICQGGTYIAEIAECEQLGCSDQEFAGHADSLEDIDTLSGRLCQPVGGLGPQALQTISAILATTELSISATPTIPPGITQPSRVSSVLATATLTPDRGNPADITTYPECAQYCNNATIAAGAALGSPANVNSVENLCSPDFRSLTAGCEIATCSDADYLNTQVLAQQLCGSYYAQNATLGSAVSEAVASATAIAKEATDGKDETQVSSLPPCGQQCITPDNLRGCGSLSNLQCVCQGIQFNEAIGPCETESCPPDDLLAIVFLAEKLCRPVGGILTNPVNYTGSVPSNGSMAPGPNMGGGNSTVPFTGEAATMSMGGGFMGMM